MHLRYSLFSSSATQPPTLPLPPVLTISAGFEDQDVRDGLVAGCGQHDCLHVRRVFGPGLQIGNQCCDVCAWNLLRASLYRLPSVDAESQLSKALLITRLTLQAACQSNACIVCTLGCAGARVCVCVCVCVCMHVYTQNSLYRLLYFINTLITNNINKLQQIG